MLVRIRTTAQEYLMSYLKSACIHQLPMKLTSLQIKAEQLEHVNKTKSASRRRYMEAALLNMRPLPFES